MPIDKDDIARLSEIFVTRKDCNMVTDEFDKKFADDSTRLAVIEQRLKVTNWLLTAVGAGVIAALIKLFIGG